MTSARRVLSPSLVKSLSCFVPEQIVYEKIWLEYGSVRDGASSKIYKGFVTYYHTTRGDTFGSFTSSPWQIIKVYFESGVSFV